MTLLVDSGFWSNDTIAELGRLDVRYTMAVRCGTKAIAAAIAAIPETARIGIECTDDGEAQIAERDHTIGNEHWAVTRRLVGRRPVDDVGHEATAIHSSRNVVEYSPVRIRASAYNAS